LEEDAAMKILQRVVLVGWVLLFAGAFLVVEFPNAPWNHAASWMLWILSIGLFFLTVGFCLLVAIRLVSRLVKPRVRLPLAEPQLPTTASVDHWSRRLVLGFVITIAISAFLAFLLVFIEHEIKSSTVYQMSVTTARASPEILATLGSPIDVSWFVSGEVSQSTNGGGKATLTIPLKGPRGRGKLWVQAGRQAGTWRFSILQFRPDGHNSAVDLLGEHR
jgi:Cytochrome oxidase complex assembly protein 1